MSEHEPSPEYTGAFDAVAAARALPVIPVAPLSVAADDAGMLAALVETKRRVLFARSQQARLTQQLGAARQAVLAHDETWNGHGAPADAWLAESVRLTNVERRLTGDCQDAAERRRNLGDTEPLALAWSAS